MSIESFRGRPDIPEVILQKNKEDRAQKRAFSPYHSLALKFIEEGRDGLKNRKKNKTDQDLNYAAIVFGVSMKAIEGVLKEGAFDSYEILSFYNMAITGLRGYSTIDTAFVEPEQVSEEDLEAIIAFSEIDRTHAIFFTDTEAFNSLPQSLRTLIAYTGSLATISKKLMPVYEELAALLPIPSVEPTVKLPEMAEKIAELAKPLTGDTRLDNIQFADSLRFWETIYSKPATGPNR